MREGKVAEGQTCIPFSASLHPFREVWMCVCVCVSLGRKGGWYVPMFTRPNVQPGQCGQNAALHRLSCKPSPDLWHHVFRTASDDVSGQWSHLRLLLKTCMGGWVWNLKRVYWVVTEYKIIIWKNRNIPLKMFLKAPFQKPSSFISPVQRRRKF